MKIKKKICFVASNDATVSAFLVNHFRELIKIFDLTVITNTDDLNFLLKKGIKAKVIKVRFSREIDLINDLYCLISLIIIFFKNKFDSVHSITPKAGLLSMIAAFLSGIPFRVHSFTGQVWLTTSGAKRYFLKSIDRLIGFLALFNLIDSPSQRDFLVLNNVLSPNKAIVFGSGSIAGVDITLFKANKKLSNRVRKELLINKSHFIFLYLGRMNINKGVLDLAKAFSMLKDSNALLLFVGHDEEKLSEKIKEICSCKLQNIRIVAFSNEPYKYIAISNVLCLPSYREGFGSVIIEAAAMNVPAIASRIYGITDAIIHNRTGLLHKPGDINGLMKAMEYFLENQFELKKMGIAAKHRAIEKFNSKAVTFEWIRFYQKYLS